MSKNGARAMEAEAASGEKEEEEDKEEEGEEEQPGETSDVSENETTRGIKKHGGKLVSS